MQHDDNTIEIELTRSQYEEVEHLVNMVDAYTEENTQPGESCEWTADDVPELSRVDGKLWLSLRHNAECATELLWRIEVFEWNSAKSYGIRYPAALRNVAKKIREHLTAHGVEVKPFAEHVAERN